MLCGKELVICIIVIALIFGLNYITQKNTDYTVQTILESLQKIREDILVENPDNAKIKDNTNETYDKWEELDDTMAYYIEHNELEKVKTAITSVKSYVEVEEYHECIEAIDRCMYILEHIHEREMFTLDNIL